MWLISPPDSISEVFLVELLREQLNHQQALDQSKLEEPAPNDPPPALNGTPTKKSPKRSKTLQTDLNSSIAELIASANQQSNKKSPKKSKTSQANNSVSELIANQQSSKKSPKKSKGGATVQKRAGYLSWEDYFMAVALLSSKRSKDPSTQVGACIVSPEKKIVGVGYNGMPNGCSDDQLPWGKEGEEQNTKYPYVCHAEMNAILNKNSHDVKNCTIYVAMFPCNECAKLIIQSGIVEVVYLSDKHHDKPMTEASRKLLTMANVRTRQFHPTHSKLEIDFTKV
ncbi:DCTD [Cordylochernes scorpioides]|uniref:dCMP deaminase n=1 Tax=Cordylochernes scorpioides TaxID=51811 RepID=A0ABY6KZW8_9ARAC|nr:DCTD [Cordylochernes scorpioides]